MRLSAVQTCKDARRLRPKQPKAVVVSTILIKIPIVQDVPRIWLKNSQRSSSHTVATAVITVASPTATPRNRRSRQPPVRDSSPASLPAPRLPARWLTTTRVLPPPRMTTLICCSP
jgi:hypothetical protein